MPYTDPEKRKSFLKEYYQKHKETAKIRNRKNYLANKARIIKQTSTYMKSRPELKSKINKKYNDSEKGQQARLDNRFRNVFGLSLNDYQNMLIAQNNVCAICHQAETRTIKGKLSRLSVDHDHISGKIRSLLCNACNTALGFLEEDPVRIARMLEYIKIHSEESDSEVA